jgi:hypothetical protein|tara:strand:+ start:365 stop:736 length:372 start_codon:yes stop_codon:yes gene_type:complete
MAIGIDKTTKQNMHTKIMDAFNYQAQRAICGNTSTHEGDLSAAKALAGMAGNAIALGQAPIEDVSTMTETLSKAWEYYVTKCNDQLNSTANEAYYAEASTYLCDAIIALDRYAIKKGFTGPIL